MPFDTYAYFFVSNFAGSAQEISDLLQLEPSCTWLKGELNSRGRPQAFSRWEFHSPLPRTEVHQDRHLQALLDVLEPRRDRILEAVASFDCGLQCVGYYTDENPGFHMDAKLVSSLAALGLSVDFDLYCYCGHDASDA